MRLIQNRGRIHWEWGDLKRLEISGNFGKITLNSAVLKTISSSDAMLLFTFRVVGRQSCSRAKGVGRVLHQITTSGNIVGRVFEIRRLFPSSGKYLPLKIGSRSSGSRVVRCVCRRRIRGGLSKRADSNRGSTPCVGRILKKKKCEFKYASPAVITMSAFTDRRCRRHVAASATVAA